jgi:hypothetical protein
MKQIHKLNGGYGATLCNICYGMISTGWTDDVVCNHCKGYKDLGKFTDEEIKEKTLEDFGIKKKSLEDMIDSESHSNRSNLNK